MRRKAHEAGEKWGSDHENKGTGRWKESQSVGGESGL